MKRYFNQVDWNKLKEFIELKEFKKANQVEVDLVNGTVAVDDQVDSLDLLNQKLKKGLTKVMKSGAQNENPLAQISKQASVSSDKSTINQEQYDELLIELRHKYITIVKSLYWEFFEEGMCGPETIVILSSSCDHAFDDEKFPMNDWDHVDDYNLEGNEKRFVNYMS